MTGDRAAQQAVTWRRVLASELGKAVRTRSVQFLIAIELCLDRKSTRLNSSHW